MASGARNNAKAVTDTLEEERASLLAHYAETARLANEAAKTALLCSRAHDNAVTILNGTIEMANNGVRTMGAAYTQSVGELNSRNIDLAEKLGAALRANTEHDLRLAREAAEAQTRNLKAQRSLEIIATMRQLGAQAFTLYQNKQLPEGTADKLLAKMHAIVPRLSSDTIARIAADIGPQETEELLAIAYGKPIAAPAP